VEYRSEVFSAIREQRCSVYEVANVLNCLPRSVQAVRRALNERSLRLRIAPTPNA
jgi:hypothetical protein